MIFEDRFTVQAPAERVWAFLRDPRQVAECIPGTERIDVLDDRHYHVVTGARVSFLSVSFALNVTVTEVETAKDLRLAKVFVSVLGDDEQWEASLQALTRARGFIRHWLRGHLERRVTPELDFRPDRSMAHAARIQELFKRQHVDGA